MEAFAFEQRSLVLLVLGGSDTRRLETLLSTREQSRDGRRVAVSELEGDR